MRIVVAHNAYQHRGGEDTVVESEVAMLRAAGHEVELLERSNHDLANMSRLNAVAQTFWSTSTTDAVRALAKRFKPDVMHVHNTFPLLSPSLYWACAEAGIPVVQTLHNFRLGCPQATFLRDGVVCESCMGRFPLPAIKHGCYRGSRAQTAVLSGMLGLHRSIGTWQNKISRYIVLSRFCRDKFVQIGLPADRMVVKPNFVESAAPQDWLRADFLFVGRLSQEKGLKCLSQAMQVLPESQLRVVGRGADAAAIESLPNVKMLGELGRDRVHSEMNQALALVVPSISNETFGLVIIEAFAKATPVIASRIGAFPEIVRHGETGLLVNPGDPKDLARAMEWALQHPEQMAQMGRRARADYEAHYTSQRNLTQLLDIYNSALDTMA